MPLLTEWELNVVDENPKTRKRRTLSSGSNVTTAFTAAAPTAASTRNDDENLHMLELKRPKAIKSNCFTNDSLSNPSTVMTNGGSNNNMIEHQKQNQDRHDNDQHHDSYWKKLFVQLQQERVTVAERQLVAFMKDSEEREAALKRYILHLEHDLVKAKEDTDSAFKAMQERELSMHELQHQLKEVKNLYRATERSAEALTIELDEQEKQQKTLKQELECYKHQIKVYRLLTGTTVQSTPLTASKGIDASTTATSTSDNKPYDIDNMSAECSVFNPERECKTIFRLIQKRAIETAATATIATTPEETNDDTKIKIPEDPTANDDWIQYEPVSNPRPLPIFLHQAIEFESKEGPALMQHILKSIFPEE